MEYIDNNRIYRYYIAEGVTVAVWLLPTEGRCRPMCITLDELCSLLLVVIGITGLVLTGINHKK